MIRVTTTMATALCDDFEGPPTSDEAALYAEAITRANALDAQQRPRMALAVTPEHGVEVLPRGVLAERLRAAGLVREAAAAMRMGRDDVEQLLVWVEAEDDDGAAIARLGALKSPARARQRRRP